MRSTNWFFQAWLPLAIVVPYGSMSTVLIRVEASSTPRTAPFGSSSLPLGRIACGPSSSGHEPCRLICCVNNPAKRNMADVSTKRPRGFDRQRQQWCEPSRRAADAPQCSSRAGDGRRRPVGGCLAPDRLARHQRPPTSAPRPAPRWSRPSTSSATAPTLRAHWSGGVRGWSASLPPPGRTSGAQQHGVGSAARAAGFAVASIDLADVTRDEGCPPRSTTWPGSAWSGRRRRVHDAAVDAARSRPALPVVVVEGDLSRAPLSVGVDQVAGATTAVEHLIALGHTRIVHVAGPADWAEARARVTGWRAAMSGLGWRPQP